MQAGQASSSAALANGALPKGRGPRGAKKPKAGAPTLLDLIAADVITPGRNNISVVYKGVTCTASLIKDGTILYQGGLLCCWPHDRVMHACCWLTAYDAAWYGIALEA